VATAGETTPAGTGFNGRGDRRDEFCFRKGSTERVQKHADDRVVIAYAWDHGGRVTFLTPWIRVCRRGPLPAMASISMTVVCLLVRHGSA